MRNRHAAAGIVRWLTAIAVAAAMAAPAPASGLDVSGSVSGERTVFTGDALHPEQGSGSASLAIAPEVYHQWESGPSLIFTPFLRLDSKDGERTHADIRELTYLKVGDGWEMRAGIGKVFWGTTEFVHLVDIVNQTDLVENIDGEEKLGQPMVRFSLVRDWGVIDLFALPYFRERTFPSIEGRLRYGLVVDTDQPVYESGDGQHHLDFAMRYSHSIGSIDLGLSWFSGTGREPSLLPGTDTLGQPVLIPFYELIDQVSLDLLMVTGQWLLKLETLHRSGQGEDYSALTGGAEYTFVGLGGTPADLGVILEWAYDDRGDTATTPFENDLAAAVRLVLNDMAGTEMLAGVIEDIGSNARIVSIEASRRLGDNIRASLEAYIFADIPADDPFRDLRNDDFLKLEVTLFL